MSAETCSWISEMILFAIAQSGRAPRVHSLAKIRENVVSRLIGMQRLRFGTLPCLSVPNKRQNDVGKFHPGPVEFTSGN